MSYSGNPKSKILVIGAYGFLGKHITNYFFKKGHKLFLVVKSTSYIPVEISNLNLPVFYSDRPDLLDQIDNLKFDVVLNASVDYGKNNNKKEVWECNVNLPLRILKKVGNEKLLFVHFDTFFRKFSEFKYLPLYTSSKREFSQKLKLFSNCKTVGLQLEHLYGENDSPTKFISTIIDSLKSNKDKIQLTSGEQKRDFIYVGDLLVLMDKLVLVRENLALKNYLFEIGTGESISIKNFVVEIKHQLKSTSRLAFGALPMRENEIMESKADLKKLNNILSWRPKVNFKQGISRLI